MFFYLVMLFCFLPVIAMQDHRSQQELCANRNIAYARPIREAEKKQPDEPQKAVIKPCAFCDEETLKKNLIIHEDKEKNVRIILNKFPYFDFDQGVHILCTLIAHKSHPNDLSCGELIEQVNAAQKICKQLHNEAYTQEYFTNWGAIAGQSVPHWHSHIKNYNEEPCSLPEKMRRRKNATIQNIDDAFAIIQKKLEAKTEIDIVTTAAQEHCLCCSINKRIENDENNFIVARFNHNYLCLSHYPRCAGEVSVVPIRHVPAIAHLSEEELHENMIIANAVLPIMVTYAQEFVRECTGGNIYTKSICHKSASQNQIAYHLHTTIMPRTTIVATPGTIEGNSCKLDYDPLQLMNYLKNRLATIKERMSQ